ncbi:acylphosphatase [Chthonobacter albigriseus]|uniref:acylphosphatase n=1 Tax=Chthonobacter albigriseus TaxID=1683161 RepID=UPI0015EFC342|nr:acylphosphatase [Chthonobacter albigriseus]
MIANGRWSTAELVFTGRDLGADFLAFVEDRARRFSLDGWAAPAPSGSVRVVLSGPDALIDMLEVACLLGPVNCLVEDVSVTPVEPNGIGPGFSLRDTS